MIAPKVFFNASVILAGLYSPKGGSGKLLAWARQRRIQGIASEIILDEVERHGGKLGIPQRKLRGLVKILRCIPPPPEASAVQQFAHVVTDYGDAHVFASCVGAHCSYLVSLDKKHILSLQGKIRGMTIVSPKELIEQLDRN